MRQVFQNKVVSVPKSGSTHCHVRGTPYGASQWHSARPPRPMHICIYYKAWTPPSGFAAISRRPSFGRGNLVQPEGLDPDDCATVAVCCGRKAQPQICRVLLILFRVMFKSSVRVFGNSIMMALMVLMPLNGSV
jgi:hypothetical protein